jgi:hypothetical protein
VFFHVSNYAFCLPWKIFTSLHFLMLFTPRLQSFSFPSHSSIFFFFFFW